MRSGLAIIVVMISVKTQGVAQLSDESDTARLRRYLEFDDAPPLACLFTYFPSFLIQNGIELKGFVRGKMLKQIRRHFGDLRAVDAVYVRAMQLTNNNTGVALLLATLATFDHRLVSLKVPIFNLVVPLTNESEEEFTLRVRNLPTRFYADSPVNPSGDRDKLQHFFGSAFLSFVFESEGVAERFGYFVEEGEELFIVGGVIDDRDRRANRQGQRFGTALLEDTRRVPSEFLKVPIADTPQARVCDQSCTGGW